MSIYVWSVCSADVVRVLCMYTNPKPSSATNSTEVTLELRSLAPRSLHPVLTKRGNYVTSYSNRIPIALPLGDTRLCVWSEVE